MLPLLVSIDVFIRHALPYTALAPHSATESTVERGFIEICAFDHFSHSGAQRAAHFSAEVVNDWLDLYLCHEYPF